jgi:hypothetical protein
MTCPSKGSDSWPTPSHTAFSLAPHATPATSTAAPVPRVAPPAPPSATSATLPIAAATRAQILYRYRAAATRYLYLYIKLYIWQMSLLLTAEMLVLLSPPAECLAPPHLSAYSSDRSNQFARKRRIDRKSLLFAESADQH